MKMIEAELGFQQEWKRPALIRACKYGRKLIINHLYQYDPELALQTLCEYGHRKVVEALLREVPPYDSACQMAYSKGYYNILDLLLEKGGDIKKINLELKPRIFHPDLKKVVDKYHA